MDGGQTPAPSTATTVNIKFYVDNVGKITNITSDNPNISAVENGTGKIAMTVVAPSALVKLTGLAASGANASGALVAFTVPQNNTKFSAAAGLILEAGGKRYMPATYTMPVTASQAKLPLTLSGVGNKFTIRGISAANMNILGSGTLAATTTSPTSQNGAFAITFT